MVLCENENQIFNLQLILTTIITKIIFTLFKKEFKYSQFILYLIINICPKLKCFKKENNKRPSIKKMIIIQFLAFAHVLHASYYILKDCHEIALQNNIAKDYIFFLIWGIVKYSLADENFPHFIIHLGELFSNLIKINQIQIEIDKENKPIDSKMHKELKNSTCEKDLDGAGGDFDNDYYEEVFLYSKE
ncbi:hypothetical protein ACTFIU_003818 [Dictyostelium citrinum]